MKRPIFVIGLTFLLISAVNISLSGTARLILGAVILLCLLAVMKKKQLRKYRALPVILAACLISVLWVSAYTELMRAAESAPKTGWVGILLADMGEVHDNKKGKYYFFHLDYEISVLELTRQDVEEQFNTYFKPL